MCSCAWDARKWGRKNVKQSQFGPAMRGREAGAPNKANPGRGDLGIGYGLGIIDDLASETPRAGLRQTKPIWHGGWWARPPLRVSPTRAIHVVPTPGGPRAERVKQSQFAEAKGAKQTQFGCRRTLGMAYPAAWWRISGAKQSQCGDGR